MTDTTDDAFDYSQIPNMPSDAAIRKSILGTAGPEHWLPGDGIGPARTAPDLSKLSESERNRVIDARMLRGPGRNANAFQRALHDRHLKMIDLDNREGKLTSRLIAVTGYERDTGKPIYVESEDRRNKIIDVELSAIAREREILNDPAVTEAALDKAMAKAVAAEKVKIREQWISDEAKRRAANSDIDDRINEKVAGLKKTRFRP